MNATLKREGIGGSLLRGVVSLAILGGAILVLQAGRLSASSRISSSLNSFAVDTDGTVWNVTLRTKVSSLSGVLAFAAGAEHTVALKADGTVWACGSNVYGQLGDGTTTDRPIPVPVGSLSGVMAIAGGAWHTVALKADGTVWACGSNEYGQLGDGTTTDRPIPVPVGSLSGVMAIAAGWQHTVALKADGTVWAWGKNEYGQLGDGTAISRLIPVQVNSLSGIAAIAAGSGHSLALNADGKIWTWGYNGFGQLGDRTTTSRPIPVQDSSLSGIAAIAAGSGHSLALGADGKVWACGTNTYGELGTSTMPLGSVPYWIQSYSGIVDIAAGQYQSLFLSACGQVFLYGRGGTSPPWIILQSNGYTMISGGMLHSLALKLGAGGTVYSWGYNSWGQLGNGTTTERVDPGLVDNLGGIKAVGNCSQGYQTVVLRHDGTVWAWGNDHWGQLGDGNYGEGVTSPVPVQAIGLSNVAKVATAARHSLAVRADGTVWTWGYNEYGNLGDGTTNDRYVPGLVSGLIGIKAVAGGGWSHSLALRADGTVWEWGGNPCGSDRLSPEQVPGLTDIIAISAGACNLALKADGTVWKWGVDYANDGTSVAQCTPIQVDGLAEIVAISAGNGHSLALKADGTVWAWGDNHFGELGTCSGVISPSPIQVIGLDSVMAIAAGGDHSLALRADGTIYAWGDNYGGQVGDGTNRNTRCVPHQVIPDDCTSPVQTGANVSATPKDPVTGESPVTVSFSSVTQAGSARATASPGAVNLPSNFRLAEPFLSYHVSTTAQYDGYVQVCIKYDQPGSGINEAGYRLYHYWDAVQNAGKLPGIDPNFDYSQSGWEDATISIDTLNNVICGTVTALSPFMIGLPMEITAPTAPIPVNTKISVSVPYGHEGSALWDFNDGPINQGTISGDGTRWVAEHTYTSPGVYAITLQLLSNGVAVGTAEFRYAVVYDPSAGFMTGGGWIDSPAGAYPPDPALTGKANFGFVSKYQKGATAPTGTTEFQFKAGDLNFFSNSYDWLVVTGAKAQFKGTGKINGAGSYKFMLTGIDADINLKDAFLVDRFRIRIWTEDEFGNESVIYDNALGDDSDLATTAIGGGSIMIHK